MHFIEIDMSINRLHELWQRRTLSARFAVVSMIILAQGMLGVGAWVSRRIEANTVDSAAMSIALYIDGVVARYALHSQRTISFDEISREKVLELLTHWPRLEAYEFTTQDAVLLKYEPAGRQLLPMRKEALTLAKAGKISGVILPASGDTGKHALLSVVAPIRDFKTGRIIAISHSQEDASSIVQDIEEARLESWFLVGFVGLCMFASQYLVVLGAQRIITTQKSSLASKLSHVTQLLEENTALRTRATQASQRVSEANERALRRIGADLHDGPVQFLGSAVLQLDELTASVLKSGPVTAEIQKEVELLGEILNETMDEIRNISAGLAPPELEKLPLAAMLETVARRHARRTGMPVSCKLENLPGEIAFPLKTCLYRIAQEGLSNATRHAGGHDMTLRASLEEGVLEINITDSGPGFDAEADATGGLGLHGLRDRVDALAGEFEIFSSPGGTRLTSRFANIEAE